MTQNTHSFPLHEPHLEEVRPTLPEIDRNGEGVATSFARWMGRQVSSAGTVVAEILQKITSVFKSAQEHRESCLESDDSSGAGKDKAEGEDFHRPKRRCLSATMYVLDHDHIPFPEESIFPQKRTDRRSAQESSPGESPFSSLGKMYFLYGKNIPFPREEVLSKSTSAQDPATEYLPTETNSTQSAHVYSLDQAHISHSREAVIEPKPSTFARKSAPLVIEDLRTIQGKELVESILKSMQRDVDVSPVLKAYINEIRQNPQNNSLSDEDIILNNLSRGLCYGEAMNIVEILSSSNLAHCSAESLLARMDARKCITYQIIHHLVRYLRVSQLFKFPFEGGFIDNSSKIMKFLPSPSEGSAFDETIDLRNVGQGDLAGRVLNYIKFRTQTQGEEWKQRSFVVSVTFFREDSLLGHAAVMCYNDKTKEFYWYDPLSWSEGLFSTTDLRPFLLGISEKMLQYTRRGAVLVPRNFYEALSFAELFFTHVKFTSYDLSAQGEIKEPGK